MFIRDIKVRSNNQIKSSEKKKLIKDILKQYPTISEEELKNVIKVKESEISLSKMTTHDSVDVVVYFVDKIPYIFKLEKDEQLFPTVYFLWKFPNILPKFFTHKQVFPKLVNGADLMLPGVITPETVSLYTLRHISKNQLCSLCLDGNEVPVGIGKTYLSGEDMYMSGMKGKCLSILHIYQDNLWALGDQSIQVPFVPSPVPISKKPEETNEAKQDKSQEEFKSELVQEDLDKKMEKLKIDEKDKQEQQEKEDDAEKKSEEEPEETKIEVNHEQILEEAFLCAIKFKSKEFKLPVLVSTFMKTLQSCCPNDVHYDLKQTRYKKISDFIKEMDKRQCIKTKEFQKGVLSITEINKESELIKYFKKPEWLKEKVEQETLKEEPKFIYEIFELFKIDASAEDVFKTKFRKGDILSASEIRSFMMNYLKENKLQIPERPKFIKPNELLYKAFIKNKQIEEISFEELFQLIFNKLSPMHEIKKVFADRTEQSVALFKGKFQPVEFKLESRGGNKKITSICNLWQFQLDANTLQSKFRKDIGCSVSLGETTKPDEFVICVQGNQIHSISQILKNDFGIQFKHMKGLEQAVKSQ